MKLSRMHWVFPSLALMGLVGCDVDVKDPGKLPEEQVTPGRAPDVDVHGPDVDVTTEKKVIEVPEVDIKTRERVIEVPDVDINIPKEEDNEPK